MPRASNATPGRPRVVAVSNQKGGEGKTTTAVNLAASLAAAEQRVLVIDLDPQANASSALGYRRTEVEAGTYEMLLEQIPASEVICTTDLPTLSIILTRSSTDYHGKKNRSVPYWLSHAADLPRIR